MLKQSSLQTQYSTSSGESNFSNDGCETLSDFKDKSITRRTSMDAGDENFLTFHQDRLPSRRKMSMCSNTSSTSSTSQCSDNVNSESRCNNNIDSPPNELNKYDDIIDKIVELRFSQNISKLEEKNSEKENKRYGEFSTKASNERDVTDGDADDLNGNYDIRKYRYGEDRLDNEDAKGENDGSDEDSKLIERGPVRPHLNNQSHHDKPYYTLDWLAETSGNVYQNQCCKSDHDCWQERKDRNEQFQEKAYPIVENAINSGRYDQSYYNDGGRLDYQDMNCTGDWCLPQVNCGGTGTPNRNFCSDDTGGAMPLNVLNDPVEASLLEILANDGFQSAQTLSEGASIPNASPTTTSSEHWPDSPVSSCNVLSSRPHSSASSRAHSPVSSSANIGSPMTHLSMVGSPPESYAYMQSFRIPQALSSSESSNHSFGDTPSPSSYQSGIDQKLEEQLGLHFDGFSTWCQSCVSSGTVVDSAETIDAIDNNELQLVEEIIRRDQKQNANKLMQGVQVVPTSQTTNRGYQSGAYCTRSDCENSTSNFAKIRRNSGSNGTGENTLNDSFNNAGIDKVSPSMEKTFDCGISNVQRNEIYAPVDVSNLENTRMIISNADNHLVCPDLNDVYDLTYSEDPNSSDIYNNQQLNSPQSLMDFDNLMGNLMESQYSCGTTADSEIRQTIDSTRVNDNCNNVFNETTRKSEIEQSKPTFNEFQIPETVSSYRQNHCRRTTERNIAPWPSLNLPLTPASERLKASLNPREVEKAMKNLLKKATEELAAADEDGDTMLMCLVGNPSELEKKRAYLVPLVERLSTLSGALTMMNNRSEDALYLAAMNCPQFAYVTGYLAAAMLQKGIDVSQRLYHTKGDTLIHAIAAKGDSHGAILSELLSLKTVQGNSVFDLSKRNYDGRTPLHVAVESHDPTGSGISCIATVRLLLENGADQKIKETKCGDTALHIAVSLSCDPDLVKVLLNKNGQEVVNMPNYNSNTPVHLVSSLSTVVPIERQMTVCMHLLRSGGLTNIQNRQGKTPLALVSADRKASMKRIFHKKN